MFGIALIPSVLLALGMAFSPESPRWLFQVMFHTNCSAMRFQHFFLVVQ